MAMLQGSIVNCQLSNDSQQETEDKRQFLKSQLRSAWSGEAVKQGVAHAKKAEYDTALGCYKKVAPYTHLPWALDISLVSTQRNVAQLVLPTASIDNEQSPCHTASLPASRWCSIWYSVLRRHACTLKLLLLVIFFSNNVILEK